MIRNANKMLHKKKSVCYLKGQYNSQKNNLINIICELHIFDLEWTWIFVFICFMKSDGGIFIYLFIIINNLLHFLFW